MVHRLESPDADDSAIEVSLRQTGELARRAGRSPERTLARYVERAFDRLDVPYRIVYDLPVEVDAPAVGAGRQKALRWWRTALNSARVQDTGRDANLLLTAAKGGGLSAVGGWASIAPGGTLTEEFELVETCSSDDPQHVVYGALHELAHCLGSSHARPWGRAWIDHERREYHRTPESHPDRRNACGEYVPPRSEGYARVDHLSFSECAGRQLRSRLDGTNGSRTQAARTEGRRKRAGQRPGRREQAGRKSRRGRPRRTRWSPVEAPWIIRNFRE